MVQWHIKSAWLSLLLVFVAITASNAQREFVASGGDAFGGGGTASYSVGQVAYTHYDGEDFRMNAGVQQPNVIIMVDTDDPPDEYSLTAFPNPSSTYVHLMTSADIFTNGVGDVLNYQLVSTNGTIITSAEINTPTTIINLNAFPSGYYFLRVTNDKREIKSFKLFKTN